MSFQSVASRGETMKITRIAVKGASGYGPVDEAYEDKVTITPSSISYEYKPHPYAHSDTNIHRKWSYTTSSPVFRDLFEAIAAKVPEYLYNNDEVLMALDIGPIDLVATFEDKHKESLHLFCPSEYFADLFRLIKQMVPGCEDIPAVLLTQEDYESID